MEESPLINQFVIRSSFISQYITISVILCTKPHHACLILVTQNYNPFTYSDVVADLCEL